MFPFFVYMEQGNGSRSRRPCFKHFMAVCARYSFCEFSTKKIVYFNKTFPRLSTHLTTGYLLTKYEICDILLATLSWKIKSPCVCFSCIFYKIICFLIILAWSFVEISLSTRFNIYKRVVVSSQTTYGGIETTGSHCKFLKKS